MSIRKSGSKTATSEEFGEGLLVISTARHCHWSEPPTLAETDELRITHKPSTVYIPLIVIERLKLVEERPRKLRLERAEMCSGSRSPAAAASVERP